MYARIEDKIVEVDTVPEKCKYASNIEFFINRYVILYKYRYTIYSKLQFEQLPYKKMKEILSKGVKIYGAIWTKKGLTYVAEFDSEGELKLL